MGVPGTVSIRVGHYPKTLPYPVNLHLPPIAKPDPRQPRTTGPELDVVVPRDDARHIALGRFMNSWSLLEGTLSSLLSRLLGTDDRDGYLTLPKLGMKNAINLLDALGMSKLVHDHIPA